MIAYVTVDGKTMLSGSRMTIIAGVFSVMAIICYLLCFKMVQERVQRLGVTDETLAELTEWLRGLEF